MTPTLDYRNVKRPDDLDPLPAHAGPKSVIPLDFDTIVIQTREPALASAIELQLRRDNIPVFRTHDGPPVDQTIQLLCRSVDRDRAIQIGASICVRREKLKSFKRR
jgi:hypothetical protein